MTHREILIRSFSENRLFLVCAAAGFLIPLAVAFSYGAKISELAYIVPSIGMAFGFSLAMFALTVVALYPSICWKEGMDWNKTKSRVNHIMNDYVSGERLVESVPVILGLLMMFFMISIVKSLILHINPYHLDPMLAALDFKIHGGNYPQYLVAPLIEKLSLVPLVNYSYNFWFGVMMGGCWFAAFIDRDKDRRNTFIWSSLSAWIVIGWFAATSLSSVGPLYFSSFYPDLPDPYAEYMKHLNTIDETVAKISVLWVGDYLLQISRDPAVIDLNGISAMPSMHVAIAAITAFYMVRVNKWVGLFALAFTLLIMVDSVYLAWHYAVDGYVSLVMAGIIWLVFSRIFRRST